MYSTFLNQGLFFAADDPPASPLSENSLISNVIEHMQRHRVGMDSHFLHSLISTLKNSPNFDFKRDIFDGVIPKAGGLPAILAELDPPLINTLLKTCAYAPQRDRVEAFAVAAAVLRKIEQAKIQRTFDVYLGMILVAPMIDGLSAAQKLMRECLHQVLHYSSSTRTLKLFTTFLKAIQRSDGSHSGEEKLRLTEEVVTMSKEMGIVLDDLALSTVEDIRRRYGTTLSSGKKVASKDQGKGVASRRDDERKKERKN